MFFPLLFTKLKMLFLFTKLKNVFTIHKTKKLGFFKKGILRNILKIMEAP